MAGRGAGSAAAHGGAVTQAVNDWLRYELSGRDSATVEKRTIPANTHVTPALGAREAPRAFGG
ncbi:MAG TPA: hypothetical protein VNF47_25600 [Streptosporangiaceae bacterium]|nr:hypothetical protein [Streptosporangiaceae bacterium]